MSKDSIEDSEIENIVSTWPELFPGMKAKLAVGLREFADQVGARALAAYKQELIEMVEKPSED